MKKKPPSRVRYEQNNPVVSARIDKTTHDKLREMLRAEGKTFAKFLKEVINEAKKKWKRVYRQDTPGGGRSGRYGTIVRHAVKSSLCDPTARTIKL